MILGEPSEIWLCSFQEVDSLILNIVNKLWPSCRDSVNSDDDEDTITAELVCNLNSSPDFRSLPIHVRGQTELYEKREKKTRIKGRHDIEFFVGSKAIVYECKRVKPKGVARTTTTTLSDKYVTDGLNRFLTGQYAKDDPFAGMLGYVVAGETSVVVDHVVGCIRDHSLFPATMNSLAPIEEIQRFSSHHHRAEPCPAITVHHAFLSLGNPKK